MYGLRIRRLLCVELGARDRLRGRTPLWLLVREMQCHQVARKLDSSPASIQTSSVNGSQMNQSPIPLAVILAEVLRIQSWAGGDTVSAERIFGLMHGIESVIRQETESFGISEEIQRKVEDMLEDIEYGKQSTDGLAIKDRLRSDDVDETDAATIMELCRLQSRFGPEIDRIIDGKGSAFKYLNRRRLPGQDWFGALHYMELVDGTDGARNKMYPVFAPTVPRVGEIVSPQQGSKMQVVQIEHVVIEQGLEMGVPQHYLVPHVWLEAIDNQES